MRTIRTILIILPARLPARDALPAREVLPNRTCVVTSASSPTMGSNIQGISDIIETVAMKSSQKKKLHKNPSFFFILCMSGTSTGMNVFAQEFRRSSTEKKKNVIVEIAEKIGSALFSNMARRRSSPKRAYIVKMLEITVNVTESKISAIQYFTCSYFVIGGRSSNSS